MCTAFTPWPRPFARASSAYTAPPRSGASVILYRQQCGHRNHVLLVFLLIRHHLLDRRRDRARAESRRSLHVKHQAPPATGCAEPREAVAQSDDKARRQGRRRHTARAPIVCALITVWALRTCRYCSTLALSSTNVGRRNPSSSQPSPPASEQAHVYYSPDYTIALANHSHARRQLLVVEPHPFMETEWTYTDRLCSRTCCGREEPHSPCRPPVQIEAVHATTQHRRQDCQRLPRLTSAPGLGRIRANSALALPATPRNAHQHQRRVLLRPRLALRSGAARRRAFRSQRQPTISQSARGARRGAAAYR